MSQSAPELRLHILDISALNGWPSSGAPTLGRNAVTLYVMRAASGPRPVTVALSMSYDSHGTNASLVMTSLRFGFDVAVTKTPMGKSIWQSFERNGISEAPSRCSAFHVWSSKSRMVSCRGSVVAAMVSDVFSRWAVDVWLKSDLVRVGLKDAISGS